VVVLGEGDICTPNTYPFCGTGLNCSYVGVDINVGSPPFPEIYQCKTVQTPISSNLVPFDTDPLKIGDLIRSVIKFSIGIAGISAFALLSFGAYKFMFSSGDPQKLEEAQQTISSAIAGLALIVLAVALFGIIAGILDIPGIEVKDYDKDGVSIPNGKLEIPGDIQ